MTQGPAKYPRTPYWPDSPEIAPDGRAHTDPERFVATPIVVTEKLDGGNTALHRGAVYARSVAAPSNAKWMAMVKKHHAWKMAGDARTLYGEDLYGVHSIAYAPMREEHTLRAFALRTPDDWFTSFDTVRALCAERAIETVPVLFEGTVDSLGALATLIRALQAAPSALGGTREGVVVRTAGAFPAGDFAEHMCKSVRKGHVQTDEHWTRRWRRCAIERPRASA